MALSPRKILLLRYKISEWNKKHPVDMFWRQHFKIPFGSKAHLDADVFDQQIWYEENKDLFKLRKKVEDEEIIFDEEGNAVVTANDTVSVVPMTEEEIDAAFNDMDFDELNNKHEPRE